MIPFVWKAVFLIKVHDLSAVHVDAALVQDMRLDRGVEDVLVFLRTMT